MTTLCGAVIARDAALTIDRCLTSMAWADDLLVVVDDRTMDGTAEIASRRGARVRVRQFADFARQRNAALKEANTDWLLFVDDDEVVSPELAQEVRAIVDAGDARVAGYWIPRKNIIFGRWVRHSGWSPDYQLRLLRVADASYREDRAVHELVDLRGEQGYLQNPLIHYNYTSLGEFCDRQRLYASMEAADQFRRGIRIKPQNYLLQPWRQFWRRYVLWEGYRDGWIGILLAVMMAYYELRTYLDLRRLPQQPPDHPPRELPGR